jgi:hypothetical protein
VVSATSRIERGVWHVVFLLVCMHAAAARAQPATPITGHYPPGQSGIRGAATPDPGFAYTNFNRFFTNAELTGPSGEPIQNIEELRYANISMFAWTTDLEILGMRYGAVAGIPFATGDVSSPTAESGFGPGDVLITPLVLYGKTGPFDYQLQFTVWTPSGSFAPGDPGNRGTGFWSLVYTLGGVYYPDGDERRWSISVLARFEQNFEQRGSGIDPGDDLVVDWGVGHTFRVTDLPTELGVSGFGAWQVTDQESPTGGTNVGRYQVFGIGPEYSLSLIEGLSLRVRAHWEIGARNIVRGGNVWLIASYRFGS